MAENVAVDRKDLIAAYMTTASVASSYKVESTKTIVEGWNRFRKLVGGEDNLEFLATLLSIPSVFGTAELNPEDEAGMKQVMQQIGLMREDLEKEGVGDVDEKDLALAFLTNASVSHSKGLSSRKAIIQHFKEIKDLVALDSNQDLLGAYLAISRIMDVKKHPVAPDIIKEMFEGMRGEVEKNINDSMRSSLGEGFGDNMMATCTLTAAYIEISPKVEKYKDILETWSSLVEQTDTNVPAEIISVVLFAGKIRDLDSMHLLQLGTIADQISNIQNLVEMHLEQ
jgi:hypothetical protein